MGWLGSCSEGPSSCQEASLLGLLFPPLSRLQVLESGVVPPALEGWVLHSLLWLPYLLPTLVKSLFT